VQAITTGNRRPRWAAIDTLRGLAIVLMALDHTRDYWSSAQFDPMDLTQTSPAMFFTRWVTHLCAPVFIMLAGTSAALSQNRGRERGDLARFLLSRGLVLVLLELTVVDLCWAGARVDGLHYRALVIWALGWSMIVLAGLVYLPRWVIFGFGALLVAGHNALDSIHAESLGGLSWLWNILHEPGVIGAWKEGPALVVLYPLVPWVGVMALGYAMGRWFDARPLADDTARRQRLLLSIGGALLAVFVVVRAFDGYGDSQHWTVQGSRVFTVLSFLDVTKYPPSLAFLLATGGLALILCALFEHARGWLVEVLTVFGRVPMFFYILHIMLIARAADIGFLIQFGHWRHRGDREVFGFGLPGVYGVALLVLVALFPLCRWYGAYKARNPGGWRSYL